jgi:hypothetical protein
MKTAKQRLKKNKSRCYFKYSIQYKSNICRNKEKYETHLKCRSRGKAEASNLTGKEIINEALIFNYMMLTVLEFKLKKEKLEVYHILYMNELLINISKFNSVNMTERSKQG